MTWNRELDRVLNRRFGENVKKDAQWEDWNYKDQHLFLYKYLEKKSNLDLMYCLQSFALNKDDLPKMLAQMFLDADIENVFSAVHLADALKKHIIEYFEDDINDKIDNQYQEFMKSKTDYIFNQDTLMSYSNKHGE